MRAIRSLAACVVLLALAAVPAVAGKGKVAVGNYESAPVLDDDSGYSVGVFSVAKAGKSRRIVPTESYRGIYYPDDGKCDHFDLPLTATSIPISAKRRFRIRDRTPIDGSVVTVKWKGHWSAPGVVAGSITIKHDGCVSKRKWTGGKQR
jgi:hypothetical protein